MQISAAINGFGRFGLHLLKYYLEHYQSSPFQIQAINDDFLGIKKAFFIIKNDAYVDFNKYTPSISENQLIFNLKNGEIVRINFTNYPANEIDWIGRYQFHLECSGKFTDAVKAKNQFLRGETQKVIISATSWNADKTLIFGYNHEEYNPEMQVISYGSCTVNAYVPIANYFNKNFGVENSDVNVIHNMPGYWLTDGKNNTLIRKFCTLEKSGPQLLPFLSEDSFRVNYTLIPYAGVSIIDFRFRLKKTLSTNDLMNSLQKSVTAGSLQGLYSIEDIDRGPSAYVCTPFSTVLIQDQLRVMGKEVYLMGYFDNENSVNRYFDLVKYIALKCQ